MNKYEEALEWIRKNKGWIDPYEFPEGQQVLFEELLNRAIPSIITTKTIFIYDEHKNYYECPSCMDEVSQDYLFCPNCGQALKRKEKDL